MMSTNQPVAVFGDVHGESRKLRALITKITQKYGETDFYGVGDLIDRGPDSKGVLDTCIEFGIPSIMGNHEIWFHQLLNTGKFDRETAMHFMMGGQATLKSYKLGTRSPENNLDKCVPEEHKAYILGLPLYRKVEVAGTTYWLVHGGVKTSLAKGVSEFCDSVAQQFGQTEVSNEVLLEVIATVSPGGLAWDHYNEGDEMHRFRDGAVQVFGHSPQLAPLDAGHFIALDTGCGRKRGTANRPNSLSAVVLLPDGGREFVSVA
jgi:hypothetical protein